MILNKNQPLSNEQKERLEKLAKMPDELIDYSDIPELDISSKSNQALSVFDPDVLMWLSKNSAYKQQINDVLRAVMHLQHS